MPLFLFAETPYLAGTFELRTGSLRREFAGKIPDVYSNSRYNCIEMEVSQTCKFILLKIGGEPSPDVKFSRAAASLMTMWYAALLVALRVFAC